MQPTVKPSQWLARQQSQPHLLHERLELWRVVVPAHTHVAVVALPKVEDVLLITVLHALKGKYAASGHGHPALGEVDDVLAALLHFAFSAGRCNQRFAADDVLL